MELTEFARQWALTMAFIRCGSTEAAQGSLACLLGMLADAGLDVVRAAEHVASVRAS